MVTTATDPIAQTNDPDDEGPGWASQWIRSDPARAVAALLILIQVVWRTKVSAGGFMVQDDFWMAIRSVEFGLTSEYLLTQVGNHLVPVTMFFMWWVTETFGYVYWPYLTAMIALQAVVSICFYRLLRLLIPAGWGLLIPLSILLFSPLNLESTSWVIHGLAILPMELAMIWAIGAQVKYVRTRRRRHLVSLAASLAFGLLFSEKALLIPPLLFGVTACLLVRGSPGRSVWRALTRHWRSWLVLIAVSAAYLVVYLQYPSNSPLRRPESVMQVTTFFEQIFARNLIPGLLGGPWTWIDGTGVALTTPTPFLQTAAVVIMLAFVVWTIWRGLAAGRAWVLFFGYAFLAAGLIAASRMGAPLSGIAGLVTRYTSDTVVVAALCIGVAVFGVRDIPDRRPPRRVPWLETSLYGRRVAVAAGTLLAVVLAAGTVISTSKYESAWSGQRGEAFLKTARAELAKAPAGTVFFDRPVPGDVMAFFFHPHNLQSKFFSVYDKRPVFVESAENPQVFANDGRIKPAFVMPARTTRPGPNGECGYSVEGGQTATLPLDGPTVDWGWAFRIAYLSEGQTPVTVRFGQGTFEFTAKQGLHQYFFFIQGSSESVDITVSTPGVGLCVTEITVGEIVPWLL